MAENAPVSILKSYGTSTTFIQASVRRSFTTDRVILLLKKLGARRTRPGQTGFMFKLTNRSVTVDITGRRGSTHIKTVTGSRIRSTCKSFSSLNSSTSMFERNSFEVRFIQNSTVISVVALVLRFPAPIKKSVSYRLMATLIV